MSSIGAAPCAAVPLSPARAEASRRNGAKSKGPKTPEGKQRSAQNAVKHGFRAQKHVVLPGEDGAAFAALEAALMEELAPEGALQGVLAQRVVAATWRLARADRLEADVFAVEGVPGRSLGLALIRDCNGARSFDTLLRYRGGTLAELFRTLRTLKALQAERAQAAAVPPRLPAPHLLPEPHEMPTEPKSRANPGDTGRPGDRADPQAASGPAGARPPHRPPPTAGKAGPCAPPFEPERREQPVKAAPPMLPTPPALPIEPSLPTESIERGDTGALLRAGTALVPLGRRSWP